MAQRMGGYAGATDPLAQPGDVPGDVARVHLVARLVGQHRVPVNPVLAHVVAPGIDSLAVLLQQFHRALVQVHPPVAAGRLGRRHHLLAGARDVAIAAPAGSCRPGPRARRSGPAPCPGAAPV